MIMSIRRLVEALDFNMSMVQFNKYEFNVDNYGFATLFNSIADNSEKMKYDLIDEDQQRRYKSKSPKLILCRSCVDEFAKNERAYNPAAFRYTLEKIKRIQPLRDENDENDAYALYVVLHEIGHYNDFTGNFQGIPYLYLSQNEPSAERLFEERKRIIEREQTFSALQKSELESKFIFKYNQLPNEVRANMYADHHFRQCYLNIFSVTNTQ